MRIRGVSKLDSHAETIFAMWREQKTVAEIHRALIRDVKVGRTAVVDWVQRKLESGELPPQDPIALVKGTASRRENGSLGLLAALDDEAEFNRASKLLRMLLLPSHQWDDQGIRDSIGSEGFGVPLNRDGEPDFTTYARSLGRKRLRTYGDMDFVLFASWTKAGRHLNRIPVENFAGARRRSKRLVEIAVGIRDEMLAAV